MSMKDRLEAYSDLLSRYRRVFGYFWQRRKNFPDGTFNTEEAEFLPAVLAVQERPASHTLRMVGGLIVLLMVLIIMWAFFGRMDIIVNAQGKVIPSERSKTIAAVNTGSVVALAVTEGQSVKTGDLLLQMDTSALDAERDRALGEKNEAVLALERNQALLQALKQQNPPVLSPWERLNQTYSVVLEPLRWNAARQHLEGQYADYQAKYKKITDDIQHYAAALPLAEEQAARYAALVETHDVARDAWLEKERLRLQLAAQWREARNQREALTAEISRTALDQMTEARRTMDAAAQEALRAASISRLFTLTAPVDGTVQQLAVHTLGGVVQAAQPVMLIVPRDGPLEVEAFIENKDKGFVHPGQSAAVKIAAFEYTKYGTLPGRITHVSQDAIADDKLGLIYAVKVLLDRTTLDVRGTTTSITPGMSVSVEIKTGDRRIIEYVLSPLQRHTHEALRER